MRTQKIVEAHFKNFTAFSDLKLSFGPGINVLIGENGTGKTHILKALYAACDVTKTGNDLGKKLIDVFMPSSDRPGRLVHRGVGRRLANVVIRRETRQAKRKTQHTIKISFSTLAKTPAAVTLHGKKLWYGTSIECVYIPVKEMLANAQGFLSSYRQRHLRFEEVYADVVERAYLPALRGATDEWRRNLLQILVKAISGRVIREGEELFLSSSQGNLEFSLLAEGFRKLALLLLLVQNGTLSNGSILFWDEPETNMNPARIKTVVEMLFALQRHGVQIFLATHDYVVLKEIDLQTGPDDSVTFFSLYRDPVTSDIRAEKTSEYIEIHPNTIADTFSDLYDRDIQRTFGGNHDS